MGPAFSGDRPSSDPSRPLALSLLLLPAHAVSASTETDRSQGKLRDDEEQDAPLSQQPVMLEDLRSNQGWAHESGHQEESTVSLVEEGGKACARWPGSEALWPQCCRRTPSSEKRSRGAASKGAARRGDDAADVLMLRGVLGALSLSLHATSTTSMSPRLHSCTGDLPATVTASHSCAGGSQRENTHIHLRNPKLKKFSLTSATGKYARMSGTDCTPHRWAGAEPHSMEMSEDRLSALSIMPTHDRPKSAALMCPSAEISRLSGLMSL